MAKRLGTTLRDEPRSFPREVTAIVRRSVRTIWQARGGGFYACGYVVTFLWMEAKMFLGDISDAESVGDFFAGQVVELFFRYLSESFVNGLLALIWPVYVIEFRPPWGIGLLAGMYLAFAGLVRKPLGQWLLGGDGDESSDRPR